MIRINLLPVEEAERAAERRQHLAMGTLVLGVVALLFVGAHVWQAARFSSANRHMRSLDKELTALKYQMEILARARQDLVRNRSDLLLGREPTARE